ncbi:MAG: ABC transporter transmembrane domain-containing protein, partial [Siphonobacter sp.]
MNIYKRLMVYAKPYGTFIIPFFVFNLIAVFFSVFQFALIIPLLNFLFDPINTADAARYQTLPEFSLNPTYFKDVFYHLVYHFKTTNPIYALYFLAGTIVAAVILTNLFRYLAQQCLLNTRTLLVKRLREALFEKINHLHLGYFTKEHKGDLLSRLNGDVYAIEGVAANSIEVVFKEPYMLIGYFVALFAISAKLMLFTLIVIPISAVGIAAVTKRLKKEAK